MKNRIVLNIVHLLCRKSTNIVTRYTKDVILGIGLCKHNRDLEPFLGQVTPN